MAVFPVRVVGRGKDGGGHERVCIACFDASRNKVGPCSHVEFIPPATCLGVPAEGLESDVLKGLKGCRVL